MARMSAEGTGRRRRTRTVPCGTVGQVRETEAWRTRFAAAARPRPRAGRTRRTTARLRRRPGVPPPRCAAYELTLRQADQGLRSQIVRTFRSMSPYL